MATGTMEPKVAFDAQRFLDDAGRYSDTKKLVDAIALKAEDEREDAIAEALDVIESLKQWSENGSGYTPPSDRGFGSDNGAGVADAILNRRQGASKLKSSFAKLGKK